MHFDAQTPPNKNKKIRRGHDLVIETPPESAVVCPGIPEALFYNCMIVRNSAH